jgi:hypothetical protein
MDGTEAVAMIVLLAGGVCMILLLATLTWLSWRVLRARFAAEKDALRALGNRLIAALWAVTVVLVATIIFQETHSAAAGLPSVFSPRATASDYGRALVLLPLGAYLLLAQAVVGLTALTWRLPPFAAKRGSDLGTALISTSGLAASFLSLATIALISFLRLSAQGVLL